MANSARLDAALAAASAAAAIIRAHYAGAVIGAGTKADGSPVTDADIAAEQAIRARVEALSRSDGFYGEETAAERLDAEHLWLVDPIDGTKSFVRGYPMFSTQIALMQRGRLELGVSSAPVYGETAWAERGARRLSRRLAARGEPHRAARAGDALDRQPAHARERPALGGASDAWSRGSTASAASATSCTTTCSPPARSTPCSSRDIHILDIAALTVIVEEAGGRVTDLDGAPIGLETRSILASNGALHDTILAELDGRLRR